MNENNAISKQNGRAEMVALTADFGTLYIKRTANGEILRPIKATMTLSENAGHIYSFQKDKWIPSAAGLVHMNKVPGVSIVTPPTIIVDGIEKPNPYVERNPKTKAIETVNVRKIGIGYNPAGQIVVIDKSLYYNIYTYLIQSIQAKMKKKVWKNGQSTDEALYKDMAEIGTFDDRPETSETAKWTFFSMTENLGIWVNYLHPQIHSVLDEHTQRQRFGDRIAQTIVERNILKDHPAIGIAAVQVTEVMRPASAGRPETRDHIASVTVHGFRHNLSAGDINDLMQQAEKGSNAIETDRGVINVEPEEEQAAIEDAGIIDEGAPFKKKDPVETPADAGKMFTEKGGK